MWRGGREALSGEETKGEQTGDGSRTRESGVRRSRQRPRRAGHREGEAKAVQELCRAGRSRGGAASDQVGNVHCRQQGRAGGGAEVSVYIRARKRSAGKHAQLTPAAAPRRKQERRLEARARRQEYAERGASSASPGHSLGISSIWVE